MGSSAPPPQQPQKPIPPISVTAADTAQAGIAQMREERKRFDFSRTILSPPRASSSTQTVARLGGA